MLILNKNSLLKRANEQFKYFLSLNLLDENTYLAGGVFRHIFDKNDVIVDFDIFFKDNSKHFVLKEQLEKLNAKNIFSCPEGKLFSYILNDLNIQLITEFNYDTVHDLLDSFDINACRFALYDEKFYLKKESIRDVKKKIITLNVINYPSATIKRIYKYISKEYMLLPSTLEFLVNDIYLKGAQSIPLNTRVYID